MRRTHSRTAAVDDASLGKHVKLSEETEGLGFFRVAAGHQGCDSKGQQQGEYGGRESDYFEIMIGHPGIIAIAQETLKRLLRKHKGSTAPSAIMSALNPQRISASKMRSKLAMIMATTPMIR